MGYFTLLLLSYPTATAMFVNVLLNLESFLGFTLRTITILRPLKCDHSGSYRPNIFYVIFAHKSKVKGHNCPLFLCT